MANPVERPKTFRPLLVNGQPVVGFDLGTTFSKAAFIDTDHQPRLVPLGHSQSRGSDLFQMPSVAILRSDKLIVGDELPPIFDPDDITNPDSAHRKSVRKYLNDLRFELSFILKCLSVNWS